MKKTIAQINATLNIVANAKISELTKEEKAAFIKLLLAMRAKSREWDEYLKEAREKCMPEEGIEQYEQTVQNPDATDEQKAEAKAALEKFYAEVSDVVKGEYESERELPEGLGDEAIARLAASNPDWEVATILALHDLLSE